MNHLYLQHAILTRIHVWHMVDRWAHLASVWCAKGRNRFAVLMLCPFLAHLDPLDFICYPTIVVKLPFFQPALFIRMWSQDAGWAQNHFPTGHKITKTTGNPLWRKMYLRCRFSNHSTHNHCSCNNQPAAIAIASCVLWRYHSAAVIQWFICCLCWLISVDRLFANLYICPCIYMYMSVCLL